MFHAHDKRKMLPQALFCLAILGSPVRGAGTLADSAYPVLPGQVSARPPEI
jgi:hypothetical protein